MKNKVSFFGLFSLLTLAILSAGCSKGSNSQGSGKISVASSVSTSNIRDLLASSPCPAPFSPSSVSPSLKEISINQMLTKSGAYQAESIDAFSFVKLVDRNKKAHYASMHVRTSLSKQEDVPTGKIQTVCHKNDPGAKTPSLDHQSVFEFDSRNGEVKSIVQISGTISKSKVRFLNMTGLAPRSVRNSSNTSNDSQIGKSRLFLRSDGKIESHFQVSREKNGSVLVMLHRTVYAFRPELKSGALSFISAPAPVKLLKPDVNVLKAAYEFACNLKDGLDLESLEEAREFARKMAINPYGLRALQTYKETFNYAVSYDSLYMNRNTAMRFAEELSEKPAGLEILAKFKEFFSYASDHNDGMALDRDKAIDYAAKVLRLKIRHN